MGADLYKACTEWIDGHFAAGNLECHYVFADMGGFVIANADSHEEIFERIVSYPMYGFFDWEVDALCEWRPIYEGLIKNFEAMAGS
jgi:hypothetical protein